MTPMRRHYVASTSLRRHVPAGNLAPQYVKPSYAYDANALKIIYWLTYILVLFALTAKVAKFSNRQIKVVCPYHYVASVNLVHAVD